MSLTIEQLSVDAANPPVLGRWWAIVLGWAEDPEPDDDEYLIRPSPGAPGQPELLFLRVPENKSGKNRLHLDLRPDDQAAEVERLLAHGATRADVGQGEQSWVVLADPEGNEFCVLKGRPPH